MQINAYLSFKGQCAAALKFYEKALGGKVVFKMTYGKSPMAKEIPKEMRTQILHARFLVGKNVLMAADSPPGRYSKPKGMTIALNCTKAKEAEAYFAALAKNGKITMPIQETFWATRFGMLTDQFGIPWMINCEKKA